jgi:hypothetical protein
MVVMVVFKAAHVLQSVLKMKFRPGTAANKIGYSSSLICGSNAAGEPLPIFIAFSSEAENEDNYKVRGDWLIDIPKVCDIIYSFSFTL